MLWIPHVQKLLKESCQISLGQKRYATTFTYALTMTVRISNDFVMSKLHMFYFQTAALAASPLDLDFQWLADRTSIIWSATGYHDMTDQQGRAVSHPGKFDLWVECISIFMSHKYVMGHCHTAVNSAWPTLFSRLQALFPHVDPR